MPQISLNYIMYELFDNDIDSNNFNFEFAQDSVSLLIRF